MVARTKVRADDGTPSISEMWEDVYPLSMDGSLMDDQRKMVRMMMMRKGRKEKEKMKTKG